MCLVLDDVTQVARCTGSLPSATCVTSSRTSGGLGFHVGSSIAFAYLPVEIANGARVEVGIFGEWVGATVTRDPLYDPRSERVRS